MFHHMGVQNKMTLSSWTIFSIKVLFSLKYFDNQLNDYFDHHTLSMIDNFNLVLHFNNSLWIVDSFPFKSLILKRAWPPILIVRTSSSPKWLIYVKFILTSLFLICHILCGIRGDESWNIWHFCRKFSWLKWTCRRLTQFDTIRLAKKLPNPIRVHKLLTLTQL